MPEGDTIFRTARTLDRALAGRTIVAFDTMLAPLAVVDRREPIAGRTVCRAEARGKHLLLTLSGELVLRTHLRMHGAWHIYRPAERWRAPRRDVRIVLSTDTWIALAVNVSDAEFIASADLPRHERLSALGPDLLGSDFDAADAVRRLRETPSRHIAEALLRQQSMAGVGNVYKSELLFLAGVYPYRPVAGVPDEVLRQIVERARDLLVLNVRERGVIPAGASGRVTTGRLNPREPLWVYGRAGQACFRCGTAIASEAETEGRRTYWCPSCQPEAAPDDRRVADR